MVCVRVKNEGHISMRDCTDSMLLIKSIKRKAGHPHIHSLSVKSVISQLFVSQGHVSDCD